MAGDVMYASLSARRPLLVAGSCLLGGANDGGTPQKYCGQLLAQRKECREHAWDCPRQLMHRRMRGQPIEVTIGKERHSSTLVGLLTMSPQGRTRVAR
jgi:hypothetical protein